MRIDGGLREDWIGSAVAVRLFPGAAERLNIARKQGLQALIAARVVPGIAHRVNIREDVQCALIGALKRVRAREVEDA